MMEQIFRKFEGGIVRSEYTNILPISSSNLNIPNKKTTFLIPPCDNFITKNIQWHITGEYKQADDAAFSKKNVKLINNFVAFLFDYIEVKYQGQVIDEVDYPGIASTIKQNLFYTKDQNGDAEASGFLSNFTGGGKFSALGMLSDFSLGFFEDVNFPIFKGGFEISFTRNNDNDSLYRYKVNKADGTADDSSLPSEGKIVITNFYLKVPYIEYEENIKTQLLKSLEQTDYTYDYKTWQCIQHKNVTGRTLHIDISNVIRSFNHPLFVILALQSDRSNSQLKNPSEFDHKYVKNFYVTVNGKRYPEELTDLDFENDNYVIGYNMFKDVRRVFEHDSSNLMTKREFKYERPIFVCDTSRHPDSLTNSKPITIAHVDFGKNIDTSENTVCNIIVVSYKSLRYDMFKNVMRGY